MAKWMAWNTSENKLTMSLEKSMKYLDKPNMNRTLGLEP
jgi:hypothetical protein